MLRRVIGFDAYVWLVTDPETSVGSAPLADVPCLPELPRLIRLKYLTTVNRWTSMIAPVASLRQATGGDLARSLMWRDLLCRYQITDIATSVYRDRFGCWAFLDLWRMQGTPPFAAVELEFLHSIAGPLTTALRHSQAAAFAAGRAGEQASAGPGGAAALTRARRARPDPADPAVPAAARPAGRRGSPPVPAGAYNVGAQLLAREAGVDSNPPLARVHLGSGHWLTLRAARMDSAQPVPERDIAVSIETTAPGGPRLAVRPSLRAEFPRGRTAGPCPHGRGHQGHRPADVRVRAHGPGSPQVDLRQDGHPHPAGPARPGPRDLGAGRCRQPAAPGQAAWMASMDWMPWLRLVIRQERTQQ